MIASPGLRANGQHFAARFLPGCGFLIDEAANFRAANRSIAGVRRRLFTLHPAVIGIGHAVVQRVFDFAHQTVVEPSRAYRLLTISTLIVPQPVAPAVNALWVLQPGKASTTATRTRIRGFIKRVGAGMSRKANSEADEMPEPGARAVNCGCNFPVA